MPSLAGRISNELLLVAVALTSQLVIGAASCADRSHWIIITTLTSTITCTVSDWHDAHDFHRARLKGRDRVTIGVRFLTIFYVDNKEY